MKFKPENLFVDFILLFMFTTITYNLWPTFLPINKVSGFFVVLSFLLIILKKIKKGELLLYISLLFSLCISTLFSKDFSLHLNDAIYWFITSLLFIKLLDSEFRETIYKVLIEKKKMIKKVVIICNLIILIGLLFPSCYTFTWENTYYIGFGFTPHSFSCGICMLLAFTLVILEARECKLSSFIWFIPGIIGIFFSGARTYLVCLMVFILIYYFYYLKNVSWKVIFPPILFIIVLYIMLKSNMIDKFISATNNKYTSTNSLIAFSNGRLDFWRIDLNMFSKSNFINILFGQGFDYVYNVNLIYYNMEIWAHNDLIDCLLSVGLFGTLIYFIPLIRNLKQLVKKVDKKIVILFFIYLWFVLIINGLFLYQHFLYSVLILYIVLSCNPIFKKSKNN